MALTITNKVYLGKAVPDSGGSAPVIDELNVTPSTSPQQITAPQGTDGYSPVNVSAVTSSIDANIVAGNIKKDVQILGVTGSYEGTTPTGTVNITSNGTHNVSSYEYAEVLVPTTAPAYYIEKTKDANGKAGNGSHLMDFSTFTDIGDYVFAYAYYGNTGITGTVDLSSLATISGQYAFNWAFINCSGITGVDLSSLTTISGTGACQNMFQYCTGLTSISLPSLKAISVSTACQRMFQYCTGLTGINLKIQAISNSNSASYMFASCSNISNLDFSSLITVSAYYGSDNMFNGCTGLVSANLSSFIMATGQSCCQSMFSGCSNLASVDISHLAKLSSGSLSQMFRNCTSLTSLSFDNLVYTTSNINGAFQNTLQGVTGCTVHFPSDWQTDMASYSNITNGLGGTNTTVLFDLPAVTTLDLTPIKETVVDGQLREFGGVNYPLPNITSVDLSGLQTVGHTNGCYGMFSGRSNLTSINISSLTNVSGQYGCQRMFENCTGITSADLGSLTEITGDNGCEYMFYGCTSIASTNLSSLKTITGSSACRYMFQNCTSLSEIKMPALKTISSASVFSNMLQGTSNVAVHVPSNFSTTLTGLNFGGSTTVSYDLPAVVVLTGADTKEYERNPKYDTATALAWRINGTMPNTTTYYTSGLTDPTVGTTIYSDSACTIAETTVDSIA